MHTPDALRLVSYSVVGLPNCLLIRPPPYVVNETLLPLSLDSPLTVVVVELPVATTSGDSLFIYLFPWFKYNKNIGESQVFLWGELFYQAGRIVPWKCSSM